MAAHTSHSDADRRDEIADAVLEIGASRGLDHASVREVATACGCAIGTVQHYFRSKDEMLVFAFRRVVDRTMARALEIDKSKDVRRVLRSILEELLPLDDERKAETAVHLAFAARAAVRPELAEVQAETLAEVRSDIAELLRMARKESGSRRGNVTRDAMALLAFVDGLALHAISAPGQLESSDLVRALDAYLSGLLSN